MSPYDDIGAVSSIDDTAQCGCELRTVLMTVPLERPQPDSPTLVPRDCSAAMPTHPIGFVVLPRRGELRARYTAFIMGVGTMVANFLGAGATQRQHHRGRSRRLGLHH